MNKWMTAAAAASALSTAMPSGSGLTDPPAAESRPLARYDSERARIVGIGNEVRNLVARTIDADPRSVVAPLALADLGLSDDALASVVDGLEMKFNLHIEDAVAVRWQTVGDVVGFVAQRLREPRAVTSRS
jgi:hypothetical protein